MSCPLVLLSGVIAACVSTIGGSTPACANIGGKCINRYLGCAKGRFVFDICGGPNYYQCCIITPVIDYEALNRPKTRNCHQCSYSVSQGRENRGSDECYMWKNGGEGSGAEPVNCTGMCSKELLWIDNKNYELRRDCTTDCHLDTGTNLHEVDCCWGDLCNSSQPGGGTGTATTAILRLLFIWTVSFGTKWVLER